MRDIQGGAFLALFGIAVLTAACGQHPTAQSAPIPSPTPPAPGPVTFRLVDGWNNHPVTDAQVSVGGKTIRPDSDGKITVQVDPNGDGVPLDIAAPGYLLRKTYVPPSPACSLWPAADADRDAIKALAYGSSTQLLSRFYASDYIGSDEYVIGGDFARSPEGAALLENLKSSSGRLTDVLSPGMVNPFRFVPGTPLDGVDMSLDIVEPSQCFEAWGFCASSANARPFAVHVSRLAAARPDVALRLLAQLFLHANPSPGLMNRDRPATDLSSLEQQTLRMIFQRSYTNAWEDSDR